MFRNVGVVVGLALLATPLNGQAQDASTQAVAFAYCDEYCSEAPLNLGFACRGTDLGWGFGINCVATTSGCSINEQCVAHWGTLLTFADLDGVGHSYAVPACADPAAGSEKQSQEGYVVKRVPRPTEARASAIS